MKKMMMLALFGLTMMGGMNVSAQDTPAEPKDSAQLAEEPKDTISIDNMEPIFYEDEAAKESSNTMTYAIIGGVVVIGGAAFFLMRKKKK